MAMINLSVDQVESISNELESVNSTLLNSYTPELQNNIASIKSNVLNTQINSILDSISKQIETITTELSQQLPRLQEFLTSQIKSYKVTEAEAEANLNAVLQRMSTISGVSNVFEKAKDAISTVGTAAAGVATGVAAGIGDFASDVLEGAKSTESSSSSDNKSSESKKENIKSESSASSSSKNTSSSKTSESKLDKYGDLVSDLGKTLKDNYKETNGLLDFIGNTAESGLDVLGTAGKGLSYAVSDGVSFIGDAVSGIASVGGDVVDWIFN